MRYNSFRELGNLKEHMSQFFHSQWSDSHEDDDDLGLVQWEPVFHTNESSIEYVIDAKIPDIDEEGIHVSIEGETLTITGERRIEMMTQSNEYFYGNFTRYFTVPDDVDVNRVCAVFDKGQLRVHLPKIELRKLAAGAM